MGVANGSGTKGILKRKGNFGNGIQVTVENGIAHKRAASDDSLLEVEGLLPPAKRVKFADTMPHILSDVQLSSLIFRKFVNNALEDYTPVRFRIFG